MKLYKDSSNQIYNYPEDGSQDNLIGDKTLITQAEADAIVKANLIAAGVPIVPEYVIQRSKAYPPQTEFLDAWVKNDQTALEAYRQACLNVKVQYPKA